MIDLMLLAIDVGNTNIVFGIYRDAELIGTFRLRTCKDCTTDEIGLDICQYFSFQNIDLKNIQGAIISSVVPQMLTTLKNAIKKYISVDPLIVGMNATTNAATKVDTNIATSIAMSIATNVGTNVATNVATNVDKSIDMNVATDINTNVGTNVDTNIKNLYYNPAQTGVDRLVNAVAAVGKYGAPLIIIDMGTATTFDAVNSAGEFMGGSIFPGVNTLSEALTLKAPNLPHYEVVKPKNAIGKSTIENLQSGAFYGYIGAIEGILSNMKLEMGECAKVIATGGLSHLISENTKLIDIIDSNLTLDGLRLIYESQE